MHSERGLVGYTNQLGKIFRFELDPLGRRITETNAAGTADQQIIRYGYDAPGNVLALTDGRGKNTTWTYDAEGRLTQKRDHNNNLILSYTYDANARVVSRTDAASPPRTTQFAYDFEGRLRMVDYPAGATAPDLHYLYDLLGRLTNSVSSNQFSLNYTFTAGNQLASEAGHWAYGSVSYGYTDRLRTSLTLAQPNAASWSQTYAYDAARRLQTTTSPAGPFTYTYVDAANGFNLIGTLVDNLAIPGGMNIDFFFDSFGRFKETALLNGSTILNKHFYVYNQGHQRTQQSRIIGANANYINYTYDARGQLKTAFGYEGGGSPARDHEQFTYTYDLGDNLTQRQSKDLVQPFIPNDLNQISPGAPSGTLTVAGSSSASATSVTATVNGNSGAATRYNDATFARASVPFVTGANTVSATATDSFGRTDTDQFTVTIAGATPFVYDANGNLTSDGRRGFIYNEENQLTSVTVTNAWKTEFQYDPLLRRQVRKEYSWSGGAWVQTDEVRYVYDGMTVIQERDGNNVPRVTYTRGSDLSGSREDAGGIGGLLARTDSGLMNLAVAGAHAYYHSDGNGNITALVNTNKAVVARYLYDPFGNLIAKSGPLATANTYRFSSKEFHENSGLYYYGYRFYEPNLQRWLNRDPIEEDGGVNLYSFVYNDPVDWLDDFGHKPRPRIPPSPPRQQQYPRYPVDRRPPDQRPPGWPYQPKPPPCDYLFLPVLDPHMVDDWDSARDLLKYMKDFRESLRPIIREAPPTDHYWPPIIRPQPPRLRFPVPPSPPWPVPWTEPPVNRLPRVIIIVPFE